MTFFKRDIGDYCLEIESPDDGTVFIDMFDELDIAKHIEGRLFCELTFYIRSEMKGMSARERTYFMKGLLLPFQAIKEALAERNEALGVTEVDESPVDISTVNGWLLGAFGATKRAVEVTATTTGLDHLNEA
jgi:hypothetical protein